VTLRRLIPLPPAALLGAGAAVLVSCGSSGAGLIPAANAGPLLRDFQAVEQAALRGNGSCAQTEAALGATERDFQSLPASVDAGLHGRLQEGISALHRRALEMCAQPLAQTTATGEATSTAKAAPPPPTTTTTQTTSTGTAPPTSTTTGSATGPSSTTQTSGSEGGTAPGASPGSEGRAEEGAGPNAQGGAGASGGTGAAGGGGGSGGGSEQ
jgi:hypothetical protein